MKFISLLFLISIIIVVYNYIGYAIIAYFLTQFKKYKITNYTSDYNPTVSFIIAAYNEENCIRLKIENSLLQNYPKGLIEYIFITDGSTDNTNNIIQEYKEIKLLYQPERRGKSAALNRAVEEATNEILIFSDANTLLNHDATLNIVRHYNDLTIGGVAGEKKISKSSLKNEVEEGEGLYWKYESILKKIDSHFYSVVGAAGELFSTKKSLYEPISANIILDDFIISMKIAQRGYRIAYEPNAYASELSSISIKDEEKRKTRIAAGGFQAIYILKDLFLVWKNPKLSFLYISHRVLRWTLSPLCIFLTYITNLVLIINSLNYLYLYLFVLQSIFYFFAICPFIIPGLNKYKIFKIPNYFLFMNISVLKGFIKFIKGNQSATWEKVQRQ